MTHDGCRHRAGLEQSVQIDARRDAKVVAEVDEILGGQVARRTSGEGRTAETADRSVKTRDTCLQSRVGIDERRTASLVEVEAHLQPGDREQIGDPARRGHARGVGVGDTRAAARALMRSDSAIDSATLMCTFLAL